MENIKDKNEEKSIVAKKAIDEKAETIEFRRLPQSPISTVADWKEKEFSHPERTIRIGTMFSGIGAIEHAFERLNLKYKIVFAGDIEPKCKKSYFANYDISEEDWFTDVRDFDATKYKGKVDFVIGGAPCQTFSVLGNRLGFEDTRGTLFYEFARVIKETEPKLFLFENVRNLMTHDNGRTWNIMYHVFEDLGYHIHFRVLNSANYGIPQSRNRVYCLGFREETDFVYPAPIELKYRMYDFLEDFLDTKYYDKEKNVKFITPHDGKKLVDENNVDFDEMVFSVRTVPEKYYISERFKKFVLSPGTKNCIMSTDTDLDVARCLLHTMHKMHRAGVDNYVTHNGGRLRRLTPRECLRLMGFKDSFKIVVSDTATYQQAGNSIVVDVLMAILKQLDITKYGCNENK